MLNIKETIEIVEKILVELKTKLDKRRMDMADQDNSNVSRYITATRWAVEQEIESMDKELIRLDNGIKELRKLGTEKNRYYDDYFVTDCFEYLTLGIISKKTELGKDILDRNGNAGVNYTNG